MTRKWTAVLAPVGITGLNAQIIASSAEITVTDKAPLFGVDGNLVGEVTSASIQDGYIVAEGILLEGQSLPTGRPTFDIDPWSRHTFTENPMEFRFHDCEICSVRIGFGPAWDDPKIMFSDR